MMAEVELYARRTHLILNSYSLNNLEESLSKAAAYKGKTQNRNTHFVDVEVCVRDVRVDGCRQ